MLKYLERYWAILVVFALCFWAVKPLFVPGFFPIHDETQIPRLFELHQSLSSGQIPPRWVQDLGFGFGYPLFNFYPPLVYYLGEIFHILGFSFIDSTKTVILTGFLLSSLFMYLWVKNHFGKLAGIFSAFLYTYSSYHFVDVYVRGDISEFFVFVWVPAIFWSLDLLFRTKEIKFSLILGMFLSAIVLTHSLTALPFSLLFLIYLFYLFVRQRKDIKKIFPFVFLSGLISLASSMYFWLPALVEKKETLVDTINVGELFNYKLHFVYLRQLWDSPWGYGGSIFGLYDGLSFDVGKIHLILSFFTAFILIGFYLKKKKLPENFKILFLVLFLLTLSLYMTSFYSQWVWDRISILSYLQFPWRFLLFAAAFSSFLGGFFISLVEKFNKGASLTLLLILCFILILDSDKRFKPATNINVSDYFYTNKEDLNYKYSRISFEFAPKGVATKLSDIKTTQVDLDQEDLPKSPYRVINGKAKVEVVSNKSHSKIFKVKSSGKSTVQVNTFSFPGWKTAIDGKEVKYRDNNKLKLIVVDLPVGTHLLTANFVNTMPRAIGNAVSLVTFINLVGFGLFKLWKKLKN